MARVFAIRVQSDLRAGSIAVQTLVRPVLSHHVEILTRRHWRSFAVQAWPKPLFSHGIEIFGHAVVRIRV